MTPRFRCAAASVALVFITACSTTERPDTTTGAAGGEVAGEMMSGVAPVVRLVVDTAGAEVWNRVRERLVGKDLDNDAEGMTRSISGQIALAADGSAVPEQSKITIDVTGLKSDQNRRDGFVQRILLETARRQPGR